MDIRDFTLELDALEWTGRELARPESVVRGPDGALWCSDGRGGATRIGPDGSQRTWTGWGGEPNGLDFGPDGRLYTANIALARVQALDPETGETETVLEEVDGLPLTCANHVQWDAEGGLWVTCTTRAEHWWACCAEPRPDGFVVRLDERGVRVAADGIFAANECRVGPEGRWLYVAETMKARVLRFPLREDASLGDPEVFGPDPLGPTHYTDGIVFDAEGNLWVALPARNGIGVLTPDGHWHVVFEEPDEEALARFLARQAEGTVTPDDFGAAAGRTLQFPSSLCFGGPEGRTAYVGSLGMDRLPTFRLPG